MPRLPHEEFRRPRIFVPIFFLSGAAGLAYQMVWAKAFAAAIGHEFPSVLAVVTAFMAGMALGNVALLKVRRLDPRLYAWLEIVIGLWGAATVQLIPFVERFVVDALGVAPSPPFHWFVVFSTVLLALLPSTAAMGATLPAAERFLTNIARRHTTGLLYGANTAGATIGAIAAAFWLMPAFGIRACLIIFAVINIACGCAAFFLTRKVPSQAAPVVHQKLAPALVLKLLFCGLLGIGFELALIRALSHVLENTVYTFAVVLAVYLGGNALGALWIQARKKPTSLRNLFLTLAVVCALSAIALRWAPAIYSQLRVAFGDSLLAVALAESLLAALFFLAPSILMGATWTQLTQASLSAKPSLAAAVAINTAGAAVAPIVFGLFVFPLIGLKGALAIFPAAYAILVGKSRAAAVVFFIVLAAIPGFTRVRDLIQTDGQEIIALNEGVMGSVAVLENDNGARILKFNNRFQMGGTSARVAEERQAAIPLLLHPRPQRVLFIGVGTGITLSGARSFPDLAIDAVELVPEIAESIPLFNQAAPLPRSNLNLYIADGRRFVRATDRHYDVIVGDLFHPAQDGAGFLYTVEHFTAILSKLSPDGLFCQWLPVYQMDRPTLETVMATFARVFPRSEMWLLHLNVDIPVIGLIGHNSPRQYSSDLVETATSENPSLADHLRRLGLHDSFRLLGCFVGPIPASLDSPLNRDLHPVVVFHAPALTFRKSDDPTQRLLNFISDYQADPSVIAGSTEFTERLRKFIQARNVYLRGLQSERAGEMPAAIAAYIESARISEEFTLGYTQALGIAAALARENSAESKSILQKLIAAQPSRPVAHELLRRLDPSN